MSSGVEGVQCCEKCFCLLARLRLRRNHLNAKPHAFLQIGEQLVVDLAPVIGEREFCVAASAIQPDEEGILAASSRVAHQFVDLAQSILVAVYVSSAPHGNDEIAASRASQG